MKYVITGSLGHISKPVVQRLVNAGHDVTVISSSDARKQEIEALGARAAIGSVEDIAFLTSAFSGADAVYTMVPPKWDAQEWKNYIAGIGRNYAAAIKAAGVKKVVNLSSVGAHMATGCGPVSGLHGAENALNSLEGVDVKHLRPGYFYYNLMANIGMIQHMGIIGGNYGEGSHIIMVHPKDIATVAGDELLALDFAGKSVRYIAGDEPTTGDVARVLGAAIGKPELPWINFKDEDAVNGMQQAGLSKEVASNYAEMGVAIASGEMFADYYRNRPEMSPVKLEDFAKEFAAAYAG